MKIAFSTVACPELTLEQAAEAASRLGYDGLELRSFGHASAELACDPCLTGGAKGRDVFEDAGVDPCCVATSIRYDAEIWPPIIGRLFDPGNRSVKETREAVRVAASFECPFVRVFGFELRRGERRAEGMRRIVERLSLAVTTARHMGVRLLIENGGSFPTSEHLLEIIDRVGSPLIGAAYSPIAAIAGGEEPVRGVANLGGRLETVKLKDFDAGRPCVIGDGYRGFESLLASLRDRGFGGWVVVEHDRLWFRGGEQEGEVAEAGYESPLRESLRRVVSWSATEQTELERRKFAWV